MCLLSPNTQPQGGRDGAESTAQHVTRKGLERRTQEAGHTPSGSHAGAFGSRVNRQREESGGREACAEEREAETEWKGCSVRPAQEGHRALRTAQGLTPKRFRRIKKLFLSNPSNSTPWHTIRLSKI